MSEEDKEFTNQYDALRRAALEVIRDLETSGAVFEVGDALVIQLTEDKHFEVNIEEDFNNEEEDGDGNWLVMHEGFKQLDTDGKEVICIGSEEQNMGIVLTKVGAQNLVAILMENKDYWDIKEDSV